jgi:hypothetical protein
MNYTNKKGFECIPETLFCDEPKPLKGGNGQSFLFLFVCCFFGKLISESDGQTFAELN